MYRTLVCALFQWLASADLKTKLNKIASLQSSMRTCHCDDFRFFHQQIIRPVSACVRGIDKWCMIINEWIRRVELEKGK